MFQKIYSSHEHLSHQSSKLSMVHFYQLLSEKITGDSKTYKYIKMLYNLNNTRVVAEHGKACLL